MIEAVMKLKRIHPDWGRGRIARELGVGERRVRTILSKLNKTEFQSNTPPVPLKGRTVTYSNGSIDIDNKEVALTDEELLDPDAIMIACRIDPALFEVVSFQHSEWDGMAKIAEKMQTKRLYAIKLRVKPKVVIFDIEACLENIKSIEVKDIKYTPAQGRLLEVFLTDSHRGLENSYDRLLGEIVEHAKPAEKVVILYGSDELHTDNVANTTVKGTVLEPIDLNEAWEESYGFYFNLIFELIRLGKEVEVIYIAGNHDQNMAWTVLKALEKTLPQATFDTSHDQFKARRWHGVGIGWTHGDKGKKQDYDRLFQKRFPKIFADATCTEIHYGHLHQESVKDSYGSIVRSLPTGTVQSGWTKDSGYENASRFQLFEYDKETLRAIYYV